MKKLKIYLVDEGVYWCDFSPQQAYENYKEFSLVESGFYAPPPFEYPREVSKEEEQKIILDRDLKEITLKEASKRFNKKGLFYCDFS